MPRTYKIGASYGDEEVVFELRSITVAEENRYTARYAEMSDSDSEEKKAEQEYAILVDAIAEWSNGWPRVGSKGNTKVAIEDAVATESKPATPADAVRAYFAERDAEKERIAQSIVMGFRRRLQPTVVFY